ncbi:MAG: Zn-dependent alcohol dehydrogenase [Actinomycetota bacterium]|nr:Zn-dependent alcohol dehydrogenase [Actinomycetota bacterium]
MHRAAVLTGIGNPLEIRDDVETAAPRTGEVKIRVAASGVCHSDLSVQNGTIMSPLPCVLGHEGAGEIVEVGEGVSGVAVGDHVVLSWVPQCGECFFCLRGQRHLCEKGSIGAITGGMLDGTTRLTSKGAPLFQMAGTGTFSEYIVMPAIGVVKIDPDVDLRVGALIGCGVLTGVGAALNTARIHEGDTVAVIGCGGVGLNVIQGARVAGAAEVIAVDTAPAKLGMAKAFGATGSVDASAGNAVSGVMDATGQRGADVVFEVVGMGPTIEQAITMTRRGGQTVLVGVPRMDVMVTVPAFIGMVLAEKTISGCWYGSSDVSRDVPRIINLWREGRLKLEELISREISLEGVEDAFEAMGTGEVARSVIVY